MTLPEDQDIALAALSDSDGTDDATAPGREAAPIGVLVKAFRVLETMADMGEPAPLRDIARATDLPKGTLFRVLQTLCTLGYISQIEKSGFYHLTTKVTYLGRNARQEDIKMLVLPHMKALHQQFNETINLGVLEGTFVYYIAVLEARRALSWRVPAGTRDQFYCTALGRAIVAFLSPAQREALVAHTTLKSRTAHTVMSRQELEAILDKTARTGTAFDIEENDDGVVCIGAPVFLDDRVVASISVSIPSSRFTPALGEEVQQAFRDLDLRFRTNRPTPAED
ncbi:MAG: IclR family transcriptional regulator [Rubellimicrobium sp.]|nr:IclR family transcriptional regulator [Rubellimicrobium sp.]